MGLVFTAAPDDPDILFLPWHDPLEEWPADQLVALPRGISRHVVRFVRLGHRVYAIKEVAERAARNEYRLLRALERVGAPSVQAVGVVTGRLTGDGQPIEPALITRHLEFSLPYRALFSTTLRPDTANRLLDALSLLIVRLHLAGFSWNDCSLSNTLFRRDAGAFAAYLVDAETGEMHPTLSDGQRGNDLEVARVNIYGELLDLQAGGMLHETIDPMHTADAVSQRYVGLWNELTSPLTVLPAERHRVDSHIRRLNELGFDVAELQVSTESDGPRITVQPKVVDAGHHSRRLLRLTGLDVQENQARRLLNDLDTYRAGLGEESRGDRRAPLAHRGVRAGRRGGAPGAARQAGAGRGVPRGARAPLVPVRAGRARRGDPRGRGELRGRRADPQAGRAGGARHPDRHVVRRHRLAAADLHPHRRPPLRMTIATMITVGGQITPFPGAS